MMNPALQSDTDEQRQLVQTIADLGLQQMKDKELCMRLWGHEPSVTSIMAKTAGIVEPIQNIIKQAVKDLPNTAVVMAGVSLVLPLFFNPATAESDQRQGFDYVTTQTHYYIKMEAVVLDVTASYDSRLSDEAKDHLREEMINLYQMFIEFEIRSILHFFSSRFKRFIEGSILFRDWKGKLNKIRESEAEIQKKLSLHISIESKQELHSLGEEARNIRKNLDDIFDKINSLVDFTQRMEQHISNKEDQLCFEALGATNQVLEKKCLERSKGSPLPESYSWILEDDDFRQWREGEDAGVFWISGDPGKGKTMLVCGIVDELTKATGKQLQSFNVCYFFCQATNDKLNKGTAVLRGLLWMLVKQQHALVSHIHNSCNDGSGTRPFEGANAWEALSNLFTKVLG